MRPRKADAELIRISKGLHPSDCECDDCWTLYHNPESSHRTGMIMSEIKPQLIEASPDLLAACKTAIECCERQPSQQEYEHMYIELKAAVAKAEGENET